MGKTNKEIVEYWENYGFLPNISSYLSKLKLGLMFEDARDLLKNMYNLKDGLIFAIIYRVYSSINNGDFLRINSKTEISEFLNAEFIINKTSEIYPQILEEYNLKFTNGEDIEALASRECAKQIAIAFIETFKDKIILEKFDIEGNYIVMNKE